MKDAAYITAMAANLIWLGMAFRYFGFQHFAAAKVLVPKSERTSPLFPTVAAGTRFLGGMNGALALFALLLLVFKLRGSDLFAAWPERVVLLAIFAVAHFSQFAFNLPVLKAGGRQGDSYWPVTSGPMLFIFVVDAVMTLLNLLVAAVIFAA
ncbi:MULTISPECIES: hypothetical protein [Kordiimonas]|jgi:hypothetical protein|uniref:hypothetical protein n=1 Tax=Kordiimonas TaxID=288021 RepID=UPI00257FD245|nr:hypothetical protein [Kordiimonas sp. UBA4487]